MAQELSNIAPCSVCEHNKEDYCIWNGKKCEDVFVCTWAPMALKLFQSAGG